MTEAIMMAMTMIMILMQTLLEKMTAQNLTKFLNSHPRVTVDRIEPLVHLGKNVKQSKYNDHCDDKHKGHCSKT